MRHGMANRKLGRTSSHRKALFRNQLASMIESERIITTLIKAKELRPLIEKMVTLGKNDSVHSRRLAARDVPNDVLVRKLFTEISPRFNDRPGGYTRIVKLGPRRGDGAEMAILEFVDFKLEGATKEKPETKRGGSKKKAEAAPAEEAPKKARGGSKKAAASATESEGAAEAPKKRAPRKKKEE